MFNVICNDINSISAAIAICLLNKSNVIMLVSPKRPITDCCCMAVDSVRSMTSDSAIACQFDKTGGILNILFSNGSILKIQHYKNFPRQYIYDMVIIDDLILDGIKLHDFSALCHGTDKSNVTHSENKGAWYK